MFKLLDRCLSFIQVHVPNSSALHAEFVERE